MRLYKKDAKGQIRIWECEPDYLNECLVIKHGVMGGEMQEKEEPVEEGKAGRDIDEQLELRMNSRVRRKLDNGYKDSLAKATQEHGTNQLGLLRPMKASPTIDKHKNVKWNLINPIDWNTAFVQRKYNGHRCLITKKDGKLIAYSRGGKVIDSITHILDNLDIPENTTLDGELYHHGTSLQTIGSWVRRKQPSTELLQYVTYDIISDEPFGRRFANLREMWLGEIDGIKIATTYAVGSFENTMEFFHMFLSEGYEGAILRHGITGYEDNKRSRSVLKIKSWSDEEFEVFAISESKDGLPVLHMEAENGEVFKALAPGTFLQKQEVLDNPEEYIGEMITIRYPELTDKGVPAQPVAVAWRNSDE